MLNIWKSLVLFIIFVIIAITRMEARPSNSIDFIQALDTVDSDIDEIQGSYYDLHSLQTQQHTNLYPNVPLDRLQMLITRYNRSTAYLRSPSVAGMNELYRLPESKRQVRYRQCYFNPISCFKK